MANLKAALQAALRAEKKTRALAKDKVRAHVVAVRRLARAKVKAEKVAVKGKRKAIEQEAEAFNEALWQLKFKSNKATGKARQKLLAQYEQGIASLRKIQDRLTLAGQYRGLSLPRPQIRQLDPKAPMPLWHRPYVISQLEYQADLAGKADGWPDFRKAAQQVREGAIRRSKGPVRTKSPKKKAAKR